MLRRFILCLFLCALVSPAHAQTLKREFAQADAAWDKRDYAVAEAHFNRALKFVGDDENAEAHAYFGRGAMRLQQEKWASARDDLTRSIELNPTNPAAFASRGMASKAMGDYTSLLADAHRAAQMDSDYAGFEDDAKSTVNWKRAMLGFIVLACILGAVGIVPLVRGLARHQRRITSARERVIREAICENPKMGLWRATWALDVRWKMRKVNIMNPKMFSKPVKWLIEGALAIVASGAIFFLC